MEVNKMFELRHTNEERSYDDLVVSTKIAPWLSYEDLVKAAENLSEYSEGIFYIKKVNFE